MVINSVGYSTWIVRESLSLGSLIKVIGFVFFNLRARTFFIPSNVYFILVKLSLLERVKVQIIL